MTNETAGKFAEVTELYSALFDAMPGNSILVQTNPPHFTILAVTPGMIERAGLAKEQLVNKPFFEPFPANSTNSEDVNADVQNITCASFEYVMKNKEQHVLPLLRYDLKNKDGEFTEFYWRVNNKPVLNNQGEVIYIIHTSEDVTEKVKSEQKDEKMKSMEQANKLFMLAPFAIFIFTGPDLIVEMANEPALELLGRVKDIVGKRSIDLLPQLTGSGYHTSMYDVMQSGESRSFFEVPLSLNQCDKAEDRYFNFIFQPYYKTCGLKAESVLVVANEVTEQVRARKQVEKSEAHLELLSNTVPAMIFYLDGEQRYQSYNKRFMEWFNVGPKEAIGKTVQEFLGKEAYKKAEAHLSVAYSGKQEQYEMFAPSKMSKGRWLSIVYTPHKNPDGKVVGVIVHATDVTYIKQAEIALQESEARFRNLADDSPMFVFIIDADPLAPVSYWNKTWLNYTDQSLEEAIGRAWDGIIHPDDVPTVMAHYTPAFLNRTAYFIPAVRVKRHDGEYRWHAFKGNPRKLQNGNFDGYVGVGLDVHEQKLVEEALKQSEQNLRNTILQAPVAMCIFGGPKHVVEIANEQMFEFWGRTSGEVLNKPIFEGMPELKRQGFEEILNKVFTTGERFSALGTPVKVLRKGKMETVYINLLYEALRKGDGTITAVIAVAINVTEQVLAQQKIEEVVAERTRELANANKELQRSNQNLEEFAHAASHDLKEPIRKINFFTSQLKVQLRELLKETELRSFNRIENATERMGQLIDDLLLYSHVSQRPHELDTIDLKQKVQRVLEDLELSIEEKKGTINIGDLPTVKGFRRQMQQLFQNLISNALKYSKADTPPIIHIYWNEVTKNGQAYNQINVSDNGIGFEQEYADKIFFMFQRLHGKAEYSGTGIGLSIVKKVVENHQGFINVKSSPGEGSTFSVFLPVN